MRSNLPSSTPKCALIAKAAKRTQLPVYDTFGPFPDEPLACSIDRILFLCGAQKLQKHFNLPCPTTDSEKSDYSGDTEQKSHSTSIVSTPKTHKDCSSADTNSCISERPPSYRCGTPKKCIKESPSKQREPTLGLPLRALRRSFSLCSLACRKLKEKVSFAPSVLKPSVTSHWLLTKLKNYSDGCQVYEVFKNSTASAHPSQIDVKKSLKIIFVILPSGIIMPFETVPKH